MSLIAPTTADELAEFLRDTPGTVDIRPGVHAAWRGEFDAEHELSTSQMTGIVEWSPEDQVVVVKAGTRLEDLNVELQTRNQTVAPFLCPFAEGSTVGGAYAMNLPTLAAHQWGDWRTWTLGVRGVRADGTLVKSGSKAVKSVAGYDAHAFFAGTRGCLLLFTELTLRIYPLEAVRSRVTAVRELASNGRSGSVADLREGELMEAVSPTGICHQPGRVGPCPIIQRVLPSELPNALQAIRDYKALAQPMTGTLWAWVDLDTELANLPGQCMMAARPRTVPDPAGDSDTARIMQSLSLLLDPQQRLCRGAFRHG